MNAEANTTGPNVLLEGVVGSTAYGLAHAGSDVDRLRPFAVPTESAVTSAPDRTLHEAAKWCRLALSANPTASALAWLQSRPAARRRSRWADSARTVALGVITACAQTYALTLIAHIVGRR